MRLRFGPPTGNKSKGWPTFGPDGKVVREEAEPAKRKPAPRKPKAAK